MFDTKEMQTKFISNMAERLNTMNFRARFREDGDLTVSSSINFLGVVGKTGELRTSSTVVWCLRATSSRTASARIFICFILFTPCF